MITAQFLRAMPNEPLKELLDDIMHYIVSSATVQLKTSTTIAVEESVTGEKHINGLPLTDAEFDAICQEFVGHGYSIEFGEVEKTRVVKKNGIINYWSGKKESEDYIAKTIVISWEKPEQSTISCTICGHKHKIVEDRFIGRCPGCNGTNLEWE